MKIPPDIVKKIAVFLLVVSQISQGKLSKVSKVHTTIQVIKLLSYVSGTCKVEKYAVHTLS